jgi:hypothetical protein
VVRPTRGGLGDSLRVGRRRTACARGAGCFDDGVVEQGEGVTVDELVMLLHDVAIERGHRITGDGFVASRAAADLLGVAPGTLANWRAQHDPIPHRSIRGRVQYALSDLALYLHEASRGAIVSARRCRHARARSSSCLRRRSARA